MVTDPPATGWYTAQLTLSGEEFNIVVRGEDFTRFHAALQARTPAEEAAERAWQEGADEIADNFFVGPVDKRWNPYSDEYWYKGRHRREDA